MPGFCSALGGKEAEFDGILRRITEPPPPPEEVSRGQDRKLRRVATLLTQINVVAVAAAGCLSVIVEPQDAVPWTFLAFHFSLWLIICFVYLVIDWSLGRFIPTLKRVGGLMLVILASIPLFTAVILIVLLILRSGPPP